MARAARVPAFEQDVGVVSMDLVRLVPKEVPSEYLYAMLRFSTFPDRVKAHANGANVLHLHPDRITDHETVAPPPLLMDRFAALVAPLDKLGDNLRAEQLRLRESRNLLLPRPISGEMDLTDMDIAVAEAVA